MDLVIKSVRDIPAYFAYSKLRPMSYPAKVLMCPPDYFTVIDVKNEFMEGQYGKVNQGKALLEWEQLKKNFETIGVAVETIPATPGLEDMVFTANQTFCGIDTNGSKVCVLSQMRYPSRRLEVPAFDVWFSSHGYRVETLPEPQWLFEGAGDALWHPGRAMIWAGVGTRTTADCHAWLAKRFSVPVLQLELRHPSFYHLDTCLSLINETTALYFPPAFTDDGLGLIRHFFKDLIEVSEQEAKAFMACNAASFFGKTVVLQKGATQTVSELTKKGIDVVEVETSEFMKSGGSVFCMKMAYF